MRFINIENKDGETVAINTDAIGHIEQWGNAWKYVVIYCGSKAIATKFTTIEAAVDYVRRASPISLNKGVQNESN